VGKTLHESYAEQFIPVAIRATAQLMELFAEEVDPLEPEVEVLDADDELPGPDGIITTSTVKVDVTDPVNDDHPTASGIFKIEIENQETGEIVDEAEPGGLASGKTGPPRTSGGPLRPSGHQEGTTPGQIEVVTSGS